MDQDLNVRTETIKTPEENTREKVPNISLNNDFLDKSPKAQATKTKINKTDHITLKNFCTAKENTHTLNRQPSEWEKLLFFPVLSFPIPKIHYNIDGFLKLVYIPGYSNTPSRKVHLSD